MKININNFKDVIIKSTMNFSIETLQLRFSDRIQSDMINGNGTSITILDIPNNIIVIEILLGKKRMERNIEKNYSFILSLFSL